MALESSFQESFSRSSSATALISTRVGTPQRAKWRGRARARQEVELGASLAEARGEHLADGQIQKKKIAVYLFIFLKQVEEKVDARGRRVCRPLTSSIFLRYV